VATVALNGGKNAGLLALRILGATSATIQKQLTQYAEAQAQEVLQSLPDVEQKG
jgi:5-(carboxyamino)imidazole ribonucleotide mutase